MLFSCHHQGVYLASDTALTVQYAQSILTIVSSAVTTTSFKGSTSKMYTGPAAKSLLASERTSGSTAGSGGAGMSTQSVGRAGASAHADVDVESLPLLLARLETQLHARGVATALASTTSSTKRPLASTHSSTSSSSALSSDAHLDGALGALVRHLAVGDTNNTVNSLLGTATAANKTNVAQSAFNVLLALGRGLLTGTAAGQNAQVQ